MHVKQGHTIRCFTETSDYDRDDDIIGHCVSKAPQRKCIDIPFIPLTCLTHAALISIIVQGARLTAFEIVQDGLPGTLIADSMASALMAVKVFDSIIVVVVVAVHNLKLNSSI